MKELWAAAIIALLSVYLTLPSLAMAWGPWSSNPEHPVVGDRAGTVQKKLTHENPGSLLLSGAVLFFQKYISPVDGPRCSMSPTCSHYSLQAIRKHGPILGFMMSADRIVHEYEEQRFVPQVWDGKSLRFYDPVENNDFWFTAPNRPNLTHSRSAGGNP